MYVTGQTQQVLIAIHQLCVVAPLKYVPWLGVLVAIVECVARIQSLHKAGQVRLPSPKKKMVVIGHQHESIQFYTKRLEIMPELLQKTEPILIVMENHLPAISPAGDVIQRSLIFNSWRSRHDPLLPRFDLADQYRIFRV